MSPWVLAVARRLAGEDHPSAGIFCSSSGPATPRCLLTGEKTNAQTNAKGNKPYQVGN